MSDDVLITPASRKIEFKDNAGNVDGKIELDGNGNLNITSPGGDIGLGDPTADVFIGDGTNNVDIVFEQNGEIRGLTGRTLTLGQSDSNVTVTAQNFTANGLSYPTSDGTNGQVLTTNGSGTLSFADAAGGFEEDSTTKNLSAGTGANDGSLATATSAVYNVAIGQDANGGSTSNAQKVVAIGYQALQNSVQSYSTAVGSSALTNHTHTSGGYPNTAVGVSNGSRITSGAGNTYLGVYNSGPTTGFANVCVGLVNHQSMTSGSYNVAVGYSSGADITSGADNITLGRLSGHAITTGDDNTFIGREAGEAVTNGDDNIAIGAQALDQATSVFDVVAIGRGSMGFAPGNSNVGVGKLTGFNLTNSAAQNTFIGSHAGQDMTTGSLNTFIGGYAGNSGGLDLRTSDSNIVLSTGAAAVGLYINSDKDVHLYGSVVETAYECTGTALDPSNGTLQYKALSANTTFTESFVDGESITLMIQAAGATVTWPTMTWASGSAPTLATSGYTTVVLWHRGGLYGAVVS